MHSALVLHNKEIQALPAKSLTKCSQYSRLASPTILNFSTRFLCYLSYMLQGLQRIVF